MNPRNEKLVWLGRRASYMDDSDESPLHDSSQFHLDLEIVLL